MKKCYEIKIIGKVQGVGFRYNALKVANQYGIYGFVKNRVDRSVFIEAEGEPEPMKLFIDWCRKGPPLSRVDNIIITECPVNDYHSFTIR